MATGCSVEQNGPRRWIGHGLAQAKPGGLMPLWSLALSLALVVLCTSLSGSALSPMALEADADQSGITDISVTEQCHSIVPGMASQKAYTITVTNNGPGEALDVILNDILPSNDGISNVKYSLDGGLKAEWTGQLGLGSMPLGYSHIVSIYLDVASSLTRIDSNRVSVTSSTPDNNLANNQASCQNTVNLRSDLSIYRACPDLIPGKANQTLSITTITNNGPSDNVDILAFEESIDQMRTVVTYPPDGISNKKFRWTIDDQGTWGPWAVPNYRSVVDIRDIPSGKSRMIQMVVDLAPNVIMVSESTSGVIAVTPDPILENNWYTCHNEVVFTDVAVSKTCHDLIPGGNHQKAYTINVTNVGIVEATGVRLEDSLIGTYPSGCIGNLKYTLDGGTEMDWTGSLGLGDMPKGARHTIVIYADLASYVTSINENTAKVSTTTTDGNLANNQASCTNNVLPPSADISVVKQCYPLVPGKAQQIIFMDTVTNNGPSIASIVQLSNNLADTNPPGGFSNIELDFTYDDEGHWFGWHKANLSTNIVKYDQLNPGESRMLRFRADVAPNVTFGGNNTATVASETFDPITENNTYTCKNEVIFTDIAVSKACHDLISGEVHQNAYTINVSNIGIVEATGVRLEDSLPDTNPSGGISNLKYKLDGGTETPWTGSLELGDMAIGARHTVVIYADLASYVTSINENTAKVSSTSTDGNPANNQASCANNVLPPSADISVVKECYPLVPGKAQQIIFTDTVTNHGPNPAMIVHLSNNMAGTTPPVASVTLRSVTPMTKRAIGVNGIKPT
jgi:uncharacterized repeat protein (TIGR01451 family)